MRFWTWLKQGCCQHRDLMKVCAGKRIYTVCPDCDYESPGVMVLK